MVRQNVKFIAVVVAAFIAIIWSNHNGVPAQARQGEIAHDALCAFTAGIAVDLKANLHKRDRQIAYLIKHPNGVGPFTARDIRQAIADTNATIGAQKRRLKSVHEAGLVC